MLRHVRPSGDLHALAIALEATAALDPYPRLTQLMLRDAAPVSDPYPRLADVMQHLAVSRPAAWAAHRAAA